MPSKKKNKSYIEHISSKQLCHPRGTGRAQKPVLLQLPPHAPTFPLCTLAAQPKLVQPAHLGRGPPLLAPPIISGRTPHRPSIFSGPAPARLLPQVPKPMQAARGRCTSACTSSGPSHRTQLLAPDSNGEARRSHYGKSEAGTRALPGFGAAAARGCA